MSSFYPQHDRKYGHDTLDDIQYELDMVRFTRESGDANTIEFFDAFDSLIKEVKTLRDRVSNNEEEISRLEKEIERINYPHAY